MTVWMHEKVPVDPEHLAAQTGVRSSDPVAAYLSRGLDEGLDPTPWFLTDWYAWQNPDWSRSHAAPYLHYLEVGQFEARDPSPFVDVHRFRAVLGDAVPTERVYQAILDGMRSPALGVTDPLVLKAEQRRFLGAITCLAHRTRPPGRSRRYLVVLQAGRHSLARNWFRDEGRDWDLMVNYYDAAGFVPGFGDYVFFQKGTKFSGMWYLLQNHADLFAPYEYVLFLDDDVETSVSCLNRLFALCCQHRLSLAQMALTEDSSSNWSKLFIRAGNTGPRPVSAVEIMMPVLSRVALAAIRPTLGQSISGFGLDLVWGKLVAEAGGKIAVLDEVPAAHRRPVDQTGGAYYTYLRQCGINAKAELWTLIADYDARRDLIGEDVSTAA